MESLRIKYNLKKIKDSDDGAILESILSEQNDADAEIDFLKIQDASSYLKDWKKFDTEKAWKNLEPKVDKNPQINWYKYAAVVVILIFSVFTVRHFLDNDIKYSAIDSPNYLVLEDGSDIILNEGAILELNSDFNSAKRNVELEGSAYFNIAKNSNSPFTIKTKGNEITVLGTEFYINEIAEGIKIDLIEGKIEIKSSIGETILLTAKQSAIIEKEIKVERLEASNNCNSALPDLKFDNVTVNAAIDSMNAIYKKEVIVLNNDIKEIGTETIHATIRNSSVKDFTRLMEIVFDANVINSKGQFIISSK